MRAHCIIIYEKQVIHLKITKNLKKMVKSIKLSEGPFWGPGYVTAQVHPLLEGPPCQEADGGWQAAPPSK